MRLRLLLVSTFLVATPSLAEQAAVNFHLDPMVGTGLDSSKLVTGAALKIDTTLLKFLGPVAPQVEFFGISAANDTYLDKGSAFGGGLGARLRLFNDEQGYLFNPGTKRTGNLWGNLWVDAHVTLNSGGFGVGFNAGVGVELSILEGLSIGPFAKFMFFGQRPVDLGPHAVLMFGLNFTIGAPQTTPADADYDGDGIKGDDDKCIDDPEDKDGFEDTDGCPETDNDKDGVDDGKDQCRDAPEDKDALQDEDGCPETDADKDSVLDEKDKCPLVKGSVENNGCPDGDKDQDGVLDRLDACPAVKGVPENKGCPDDDTDADGTVDRLDDCKTEKGPAANKGCPYPDTDKDTVTDNIDNCINEAGPVENQGCPVAVKQLVVITSEALVIKDKVFFDTDKATIQKRSNGMLDQIVSILNSHTEIKEVQVEGHTDNVGDAAHNRTLSANRAQSVVDYLVKKGIAANRLKPMGFGPDRPAEDNATPKGKEANRRVEFNIIH